MTPLIRAKRWWRELRGAREARTLGLFDANYYRKMVSGRPDEAQAHRRPLKHYLAVGGFEGLDPSSEFDSAWYRATYRDVESSGLNPLVHYVLYGMAEGRRPYLGAKPPHISGSPHTQKARQLGEQLWAGFAWRARPELEALARGGDAEAAWHLALWTYGLGERETSREWLALASAPGGTSQHALALVKCGVRLNASQKATLNPEARALVEVNEASSPQEALEALNGIYRSAGLTTLDLKGKGKPASLDNLCAQPEKLDQQPLVSVVMCAHNAQNTLPTALESVLTQSWQNLEVIVVDDASADQTAELVRRYIATDSRVRLVSNARNLGAYGARNRGAREALGQYITVHDSDDWSHPQKLERQLAPMLADVSVVASVSQWVRVRPPLTMVGAWQLNQGFLERNPSSWLVRRDAFARIGYWDEVKVEADTEFALRLEHHFGKEALVNVLPEVPLALARVGAETLTQQSASHVRTQFYGLRRLYAESAQSWHRASKGKPVMVSGHRPFSLPLGSIIGSQPAVKLAVVGDFAAQGKALEKLIERLDNCWQREPALCLMHWPTRTAWAGNEISDAVFDWAWRHNIHWAHPGLTLQVSNVELLHSFSWEERPSPVAALPNVETVLNSKGEYCEPQEAWLDYFRAGGGRF